MQETRTKSNIQASAFYVMIMGQIESATFPSYVDSLYCRYVISYGIDWDVVHGVNSGITQIARRCDIRNQESIIWNFPLDVSFKATNPYGWPRIALGVYGLDALGRDVARGYGSLLIPISAGSYTKHIRTYTPISGSVYQRFLNWIAGTSQSFMKNSNWITNPRNIRLHT